MIFIESFSKNSYPILASCQFHISNQHRSEKTPSVGIHQQDINKFLPLQYGLRTLPQGEKKKEKFSV